MPKLPAAADTFPVPPPPDYTSLRNWAALPTTDDAADRTPSDTIRDGQATVRADEKLNTAVDQSTILNQASIFNAAGKVYAPRYRQANLSVFYDAGAPVKQQALDTAYTDVLAAFDYYLTHFNHGRPVILAAHSQGTLHAIRLLQDRFVGKPLHDRLIAAYLVGMPVRRQEFADIPVCTSPTQSGCFVTWRTYREDYLPSPERDDPAIAVVNPLTWTTSPERAPAYLNKGGVLYNYSAGIKPELVGAQIRGAFLHTNKPRFFGDIFFRSQNYHVADYNFFWMNVRENAVARSEGFKGSGG